MFLIFLFERLLFLISFFSYPLLLAYLSSEKKTGSGTKFDDILKDVQDVYAYNKSGRTYKEFKLFITGHSLGGALCSLFSVALAGYATKIL